MKKRIFTIGYWILFSLFTTTQLVAQTHNNPLTRAEIDQRIRTHYKNNKTPFKWSLTDAHTIWSAAMRSDGIIAIGYKPIELSTADFKENIGKYNFNSTGWEQVRKSILNETLDDILSRNPSTSQNRSTYLPFGEKHKLPYVLLRVPNLETVQQLFTRKDVRFVEPMGYAFEADLRKSGVGCGDYVGTSFAPSDLVLINGTCNSIRSWHHTPHNIECAWSNGWNGQGIGVAVLDSGISDAQSQLNLPDFAECESAGRSFAKTGFFTDAPSGSDDCGHGTAMSGLLAAPWDDDGEPVGIAYLCDFTSYRVAENVLLDASAEFNAVADAYVAAADDPNIKITSMSLGTVVANGVVETAIQYAYSKDLMMFCAAGTSTGFTNWYPVIFPAWMPETVACTGVTDAPIASRSRCETCHDGPEVDFVAVMERDVDKDRKSISIGVPDLSKSYVGGSSASTASMAGMAAVVWSANPTATREQIYNRMAQASDYYPGRDDDLGWGVVDVCKAADPNFAAPCDPALANTSIKLEITNITFPAETNILADMNDWVIELNGQKYFFEVPETGASGDPATYHNASNCGIMPMVIDIGSSSCGQSMVTVLSDIHDDNSLFGNCNYNPNFFGDRDDNQHNQNISIDFTSNTFVHNHPSGNFVFTFNATCSPASVPAVSVGGLARICEGDTSPDVTFNFAGGTPPYTATYTMNGGSAQTITTMGGSSIAT
ncbi:MAG: S8/S53 family peptidase, partial [Bacteroidota bacterium]